jgi:hypothetical protein
LFIECHPASDIAFRHSPSAEDRQFMQLVLPLYDYLAEFLQF